jgi:3-oxoadipate enol-lactonase
MMTVRPDIEPHDTPTFHHSVRRRPLPIIKLKNDLPNINMVRTGPRGGAPVVLLHGVGLDLTYWDLQIAALCTTHDVIAFDMPGHGLSGKLPHPPSFGEMAAILAGVLDHAETGPAHLVGASVGGMIAQTLALQRPDLVRSLSLVATLCTFPDAVRAILRERARVSREEGMSVIAPLSLERWFPAAFRARRPDVMDRATKILLRQDAECHASMWDMIASLDLEARLPSLSCPTMVVAGAEDVNAPPVAARQIAELIPGAELYELAGAGHFPPIELPDAFNELLVDFLQRQSQ